MIHYLFTYQTPLGISTKFTNYLVDEGIEFVVATDLLPLFSWSFIRARAMAKYGRQGILYLTKAPKL